MTDRRIAHTAEDSGRPHEKVKPPIARYTPVVIIFRVRLVTQHTDLLSILMFFLYFVRDTDYSFDLTREPLIYVGSTSNVSHLGS